MKEISTKRKSQQGTGSERWIVNDITIYNLSLTLPEAVFTPPKATKKRLTPTLLHPISVTTVLPSPAVKEKCQETEANQARLVTTDCLGSSFPAPLDGEGTVCTDSFYVKGEGFIKRQSFI